MKNVVTAAVLAASLGIPAVAQDASVSGDPFVASQSAPFAGLDGLGAAGTTAAVIAGVIVLGVIIEATGDDDDDEASATSSTPGTVVAD